MSTAEEDREFQRVVMEGLVPRLAESAVAIAITPSDEENYVDAKFCVELGAMIMLDKPILAVVQPGAKVPEKLKLVADEIVEADITTPEGQEHLGRRISEFAVRFQTEH